MVGVYICSDVCLEACFYQFDTKIIFVVQNMSKWRTSAWLAVWRGRENLSRTSGGCLAWMVCVRRRKSGKAGGARLGSWALIQPCDKAVNIDGGGDRDVLHVGLDHAITMPS